MDEPRALRLTRRDALLLVTFLASLPPGCWTSLRLGRAVFCLEESGFSYVNNIRSERPYTAQVHTRNCGATTSLHTWVTMRTGTATEYSLFSPESATVLEGKLDPYGITLKWESPTVLVIEYPGREQGLISKTVTAWRDITIIHRLRWEQP